MAEMADDHVPNSSSENVAMFKNMKHMNTEAKADTPHLLLRELEHAISLVGPAKEEIAKLQLELKRHQVIPKRAESEKVAEMQFQLESAKRECKELQTQLKDEKLKNETQYNDKVVELQNANAKIRELVEMKESVRQQEEKMRADHKEEIDAYKEVNRTTESHLQSTYEKVKELQDAQQRLEQCFTNNIRKQQQEITKLTASLQNVKLEKDKVEKSLSETQSRLSKLMGDKLSDNNPDIADLSDNNRPTKLAEKYQELYDNQWTDAFEVAEDYFGDKTEEFRIKTLLRILMRAFNHCTQEIKRQDQELLQALYRTSSIEKTSQDLPATVKSRLKELKRLAATDAIRNLTEGYLQGLDTKTSFGEFNLKVKEFVRECITVCWLMVCQDPPLVFHLNVKKGEQFDNNKYKHYTLTGTVIDYVVWPALLLHQEGSVLCKGIVQCTKPVQGSKSLKVRSRQVDAAGIGIPTGSVRLTSSEMPVDTTKWFSDGISHVADKDRSSTDASNMNKLRQKHTQSTKNITNPQDQQEFAPKEREKTADAKDHTKHQQPARGNEHPSQQQGPAQHLDKSTEKEDNPNRQKNPPLNLYRSEAKVPLHTSKHGSTQQSSAEFSRTSYYDDFQMAQLTPGNNGQCQSVSGNYQQQNHAYTDGSPSTANKQYQNRSADNKKQSNQHAAGSYQENQPSSGNLLHNQSATDNYQLNQPATGNHQQNQPSSVNLLHNQSATDNYQLNQPATGNHQQNQPNTSFNEPIQNQYAKQSFSGSNQQLAQASSSVTDQRVSQQQSVSFNTHTNIVQYPAHLVPTTEEYKMYIEYNNYYRNSYLARFYLGAQIYDKCTKYLAWVQSMQYNF